MDREHLVSSGLDLIPTLCDYADIQCPTGLRGRSVRALAEGRSVKKRRGFLVCETTFTGFGKDLGITGRMLRTGRYKYIVYSKGKVREQLFDMIEDPGETINLSDNAAYKSVLENHRGRLAAWCEETGDSFAGRSE